MANFEFGQLVPGYSVRVINEREVRGAAGILFLVGFAGLMTAILTQDQQPIRGFALLFLIDMHLRLFVSPNFSPTLRIARVIVRNQKPEWVGASQKRYAWGLGLGMALLGCFGMGLLGAPMLLVLVLCSLCQAFLFLEAAFGICVGCKLQRLFGKTEPQYCPGGTCER